MNRHKVGRRLGVFATLIAWLGMAAAGNACAAGPATTVPTADIVQTFRTDDPAMPKTYSAGAGIQKIGDYLYLSSRLGGTIQYFKWDAAAGKLSYVGTTEENSLIKSGMTLIAVGNRLYGVGAFVWGAKDGDKYDGLTWYDIDPATGKPTEKGAIAFKPGSWFEYAAAGPDGKDLYVYTRDGGKLTWFKLGADGAATVAGAVTGKGVGSNPAISPDGKWLYVSLFSEQARTAGVFGIFKRDGATGALTLSERITACDGASCGLACL